MGFQPGMRSVREGISVIGSLKCRSWNGVIADLWQAECQAGATGEYVSDHPRLFIVLDKVGGSFETRLDPSEPGVSPRGGAHSISFMPAGVPVWGRTQQRMRIRHLDLHFDPASVSERLGEALSPELLRQPRIMFTNERIQTLARLIAGECAEPDARHDLYGDGLVMAVLIDLFGVRREAPRRRTPAGPGLERTGRTGDRRPRRRYLLCTGCRCSVRRGSLRRRPVRHLARARLQRSVTGTQPAGWKRTARGLRRGSPAVRLRGDCTTVG